MEPDKYRFLFDSIDRGVVFHGPDGSVTDANAAAERILGIPVSGLVGRRSEDKGWRTIHEDGSVFPGEDHPAMVVFRTGQEVRNVVMGIFSPVRQDFFWVRLDAVPWQPEGPVSPLRVCVTIEDITDLVHYREEVRLNEQRLKSLIRIQQYSCETVQDFLDYALEEAIQLTGSRIGYIYHYNEANSEFTLNTWSRGVMAACSITDPQTLYHLDETGLWGEAVRQRKPIILNDFQSPHPEKKGYPEGHAPLRKFMTVPVFNNNQIVAVVGVANKETDYTETDILQLTLLMESVWKETERIKAEEQLENSRILLEQALNQSPVPMVLVTMPDAILRIVNPACVEFLGMQDEPSCVGIPLSEFKPTFLDLDLSGKPSQMSELPLARSARGEQTDSEERIVIRKDGSKRRELVHAVPIRNSRGEIIAGFLIIIDITKQKQFEDELRNSEARFRRLFNQSPLGAVIVGLDFTFHQVNETFCNMLGYNEMELIGKTFPDITHPDFIDRDIGNIKRLIDGEIEHFSADKKYIRKDGSYVWARVSVRIIRDEAGHPLFLLPIIEEITERKEAEAELLSAKEKAEESDRLKTAFLNNISHEIRTPLNGLLGFSGCLLDPDLDHEEQVSYLEIIDTCGKQLLSIIDDIVSIALIDAGQARMKPVQTDLVVMIENLYKQFLPVARRSGVLLVSDCRFEGCDSLFTDEIKLTQILSNLLHNALKFCREGSVTLSCHVSDNRCHFAVSDTGIGIAPEKQVLIFERFRQAEESISQEFGGTGLGLSIAKAYTELLGGVLQLKSAPGQGASFYFNLPLEQKES